MCLYYHPGETSHLDCVTITPHLHHWVSFRPTPGVCTHDLASRNSQNNILSITTTNTRIPIHQTSLYSSTKQEQGAVCTTRAATTFGKRTWAVHAMASSTPVCATCGKPMPAPQHIQDAVDNSEDTGSASCPSCSTSTAPQGAGGRPQWQCAGRSKGNGIMSRAVIRYIARYYVHCTQPRRHCTPPRVRHC